MKKLQTIDCDCTQEIDRMIDGGLSGGTLNPKYTEAHLKLKEKYQGPPPVLPVEMSEQGGELK
ncbi:hypothetical protein [Planococcus sp. ISL-110]|uniref:hypothetical protein n=1 Tax=Planococcus sp. ISL-110 TaxID=2819167 RepID=UPI001BE93798|nr:hypothetical protein [Planococcus sp. ISL-110]MBT2569555.1 hypothetical protein [Planococcus sp. ISL-110]